MLDGPPGEPSAEARVLAAPERQLARWAQEAEALLCGAMTKLGWPAHSYF